MWRRRVVRVWEEAGGDGEEEANVNVEDGEEGWSGGAGYMELGGRAATRIRRRRRCMRARRRRARMGRMREGGVASTRATPPHGGLGQLGARLFSRRDGLQRSGTT